jgi:hypothetical protein
MWLVDSNIEELLEQFYIPFGAPFPFQQIEL